MPLSTYAELKTAVADWLKRGGVTGIASTADIIPDFITIGEEEIFRRLRIRPMEASGTLTCVAGTSTVALPTRFKSFKWLYVAGDPKVKLEYASGERIYTDYAGSTTGKPKLFSYSGDNLLLGPTPDSAYTLNYLAYIAPLPLSGSQTTNTLFPAYPTSYLYAALKAAYDFLEDERGVARYEAKLNRALKLAQDEDTVDRHSGSTLRARGVGGP